MRIPEFLFPLVNAIVRVILQSPLHGMLSNSVMLVRVTGRKSGTPFAVPLRYLRHEGTIRCSTSRDTQWWRNVRANPDVILRISGEEAPYHAAIVTDEGAVRDYLLRLIDVYPQDAVYHQMTLDRDNVPDKDELARAVESAIVVVATPADAPRS